MAGLVCEHVVTRSCARQRRGPRCDLGPPSPVSRTTRRGQGASFLALVRHDTGTHCRIGIITSAPTDVEVHPDCVRATEDAGALCEASATGWSR